MLASSLFQLSRRSQMMMKGLSRAGVHTIARAPSQAIGNAQSVVVYDSPDFKCK